MKSTMNILVAVFLILIIGVWTGVAQAEELNSPVKIMAFSPVTEATCVAVEVTLQEGQTVAGLMWYNNDEESVFPSVLAAAAYDGMPPDYSDALVIVENVTGVEDGWSELQFPQPIASPTGMFYVIFQFPSLVETAGRGVGPGIGYESVDDDTSVYLSAEGEEWIRMITAQRILIEPVYVTGAEKSSALMLPDPSDAEGQPQVQTEVEEIIKVTRLLRPYPNPFNPVVSFEFTLKNPSKVRLSIFDLRGRLVNDLVNETLPMGRYERTWQGKNSQGGQMASGVYFARMEADGQNWTHRMILLK